MAKFRMVHTEFWSDVKVVEEMTPEDKYFFLYLLTNEKTTQIGIYQITKKQMAFDMGYSIESINSLLQRFIDHHKMIRYNPETREIAIRNWGRYNFNRGGKPVMDCVRSELKQVKDITLIPYVAERIEKDNIKEIYESYYDTLTSRDTIRGQEKEEEKEKEEEQQEEVAEIIQFWDNNGFGYNNINAKQRLLSWLDNTNFKNPKEMILEALEIASTSNKRRLNYVEGILRNWENESLLTLEEIRNSTNKPNKRKSVDDIDWDNL